MIALLAPLLIISLILQLLPIDLALLAELFYGFVGLFVGIADLLIRFRGAPQSASLEGRDAKRISYSEAQSFLANAPTQFMEPFATLFGKLLSIIRFDGLNSLTQDARYFLILAGSFIPVTLMQKYYNKWGGTDLTVGNLTAHQCLTLALYSNRDVFRLFV
jgi:hypothetical protein